MASIPAKSSHFSVSHPGLVHFVAVVLLALPAASRAGGGAPGGQGAAEPALLIGQATAAYDAMEHDKALKLLEQAERQPGLGAKDRIEILKYRAFIHILYNREILARDAVTSIYKLEPDFALPPTVSPKFRRFFADVKKDLKPTAAPAVKPVEEGAPRSAAAHPAGSTPSVTKQAPGAGDRLVNLLLRFWPSWTCLAAGTALLIPGAVIGAGATSDRQTLTDAPMDETGRIVGITRAEAEKMQDEASSKALTANILMGVGAAALAGGAVMFFVYDGDREVKTSTSVSLDYLNGAWVVRAGGSF